MGVWMGVGPYLGRACCVVYVLHDLVAIMLLRLQHHVCVGSLCTRQF